MGLDIKLHIFTCCCFFFFELSEHLYCVGQLPAYGNQMEGVGFSHCGPRLSHHISQ